MDIKPQRITVDEESVCLPCEETVEVGTTAWWVEQIGVWHDSCDEPRNIQHYIREVEKRQSPD